MTKFCNLKIAINDQQPLDEVVKELERLGYTKEYVTKDVPQSVKALDDGVYQIFSLHISEFMSLWSELTTLAELKEM